MTVEREVLQITDDKGDLHFYEITPLQKRVLVELPLLDNEDDLSFQLEVDIGRLLDEPKVKQEAIMMELPVINSLSKKLGVNRTTLVNALNRKNAYRPSLMEMGVVGKVLIGKDVLRYPMNYFYKKYDGEMVTQEFEEDNKTMSREELTPGYNKWRQSVLNRDKVCQCCGLDKHLHVHHLFGYKERPELATDVGNGVTLCKFCHDKYHSIYGLKDINPLDFMEFMDRFKVKS